MTRGKTPSSAASLHEQTVRHHCRVLKMPTVAGQFETLAQPAIREGVLPHGRYAVTSVNRSFITVRKAPRSLPLIRLFMSSQSGVSRAC